MMSHPGTRVYRDGGYGWVVVMAAFFTGCITDGISFSFGILLGEIIEIYQTERGKAAIAGSLVTGALHIIGPISGVLTETYGYRAVVVSGGIVSSAGMVASAFVPSLPLLYLTYGILGGVGFGFMYLPACVCVIHNFEKRRSLASGISVCGSGMGMFVFNVLTRFLLDTYGLQGTFLILSGLCLHGVVLGLLLNDPPQDSRQRQKNLESKLVADDKTFQDSESEPKKTTRNKNGYTQVPQPDCYTTIKRDRCSELDSIAIDNDAEFEEKNVSERPIHVIEMDTEEAADSYSNKFTAFKGRFRKVLMNMCDVTLLKNVPFVAYLISVFCLNFSFIIPIHLLPDQAEQLGIQKHQVAWLASSIGITNTVGRILVGLLGDWKRVNRFAMFVGLVIASGICTGFSTLLVTFEGKMVYACIFGLLLGGFITLTMVVLADTVGPENISKAFGLVMFCIGISGTFSTPVGGWLFDVTGTYDFTFIIAGGMYVLSGVIVSLPAITASCFSNH